MVRLRGGFMGGQTMETGARDPIGLEPSQVFRRSELRRKTWRTRRPDFYHRVLADRRWGFMIGLSGAHQDQRALGKGRIDQERCARQRQSEIDVVEEKERRERP